MKVRCRSHHGVDVPLESRDAQAGFGDDKVYGLKVDVTYCVMGISNFLGRIPWYYVYEFDNRLPTWCPGALFDIVEGGIPSSWEFGYHRFSSTEHYGLVTFREWARNPDLYADAAERIDALEVFDLRHAEVHNS